MQETLAIVLTGNNTLKKPLGFQVLARSASTLQRTVAIQLSGKTIRKHAFRLMMVLSGIILSWISVESSELCTHIDADHYRLQCYDKAFMRMPANAAQAEISNTSFLSKPSHNPYGAWQIDTRKSLLDDSDIVILRLSAEQLVVLEPDDGLPRRPALFITCNEGDVSLWLNMGTFVTDFYSGGRVTYRLDDQKIRTIEMRESSEQNALGLWSKPQSLSFIRELSGANKLVVRVTPVNTYQITLSFDLTGIEHGLKLVKKACAKAYADFR